MLKQKGIMLLESLIGVLLFSIGIIAMMGLQSSALSNMSDSKYRADASVLANQIFSEMTRDLTEVRMLKQMQLNSVTIPSTARTGYRYPDGSYDYHTEYNKTKTHIVPVNSAKYNLSPSMSTAEINSKPEPVINWLNNVQDSLPGISDVKLRPTVTVTECKIVGGNKSDTKCPNAFNSTGSEAYASIVDITMRWKLPNQKCDTTKEQSEIDKCVRRHTTSMYIMYDDLDYLN